MSSADSCRFGASGVEAARKRKGSSSAQVFSGRRSVASSDMASQTFLAMGLGGSDWSAARRWALSATWPLGERTGQSGCGEGVGGGGRGEELAEEDDGHGAKLDGDGRHGE